MKAHKFDNRHWFEAVVSFMESKTTVGDVVEFKVQFQKNNKPSLKLVCNQETFDVGDFLEDFYPGQQDSTLSTINYMSWRDYVTSPSGIGAALQNLFETNLRTFTYVDLS